MRKLLVYSKRIPTAIWERIEVDWSTYCWEWVGPVSTASDGHVTCRTKSMIAGLPGKSRTINAVKYMYSVAHGLELATVPTLYSKCNNARCVNPEHRTPNDIRAIMYDISTQGICRRVSPAKGAQ